jgi:hypothetical protein
MRVPTSKRIWLSILTAIVCASAVDTLFAYFAG